MSIVRMKRLRLVALCQERDTLLSRLLHLGCVEVSEPGEDQLTDPRWTALLHRDTGAVGSARASVNAVSSAMEALDKYAPEKKGLFVLRENITEEAFLDVQAADAAQAQAQAINDRTAEIGRIRTQIGKVNAQLESLQPWMELDLPLETQETEFTDIFFGACPSAVDVEALRGELAQAAPLAELIPISADKEQHYLLLIVHKEQQRAAMDVVKEKSFSTLRFKDLSGTPRQNAELLKTQLEELHRQEEAAQEDIAGRKESRRDLRIYFDRLNQDVAVEEVKERTLTTGTLVTLEGWVPASCVKAVEAELMKLDCAYEVSNPQEGDTVPTLLKNGPLVTPMNMVTEMYSLPSYDGIDPNPLIFPFFTFFYGFMFADIAYGLIIFLVSLIITKKYHPKGTMGYMFKMGMEIGIMTTVCGALTGGFFGDALSVIAETFLGIADFQLPAVIRPLEDPMTVLYFGIAVGIVHMIFGQCVHIYMGFRDGGGKGGADAALDVVPWWIVFAGVAAIVLAGNLVVLIVGLASLVLTQGRHNKGILKKLWGGISSLYDITSWLGDVLSYARLMALMLATTVIASVVNILGSLPGNIIVFIIVFLIGHTFNVGINVIGTYVHAARLQYLEFFGKFYKDGGVAFRPLCYNTKYVDVLTREGK